MIDRGINYKILGKRIKKNRLAADITQAELAEAIQKTPEYISKIETGKAHPSLETLNKLCNNLQIDLCHVLTGIVLHDSDFVNAELFEILSDFTTEQIEFIIKFAETISHYNIKTK